MIANDFVFAKDFHTYTIIILRQDKSPSRIARRPAGSGGRYDAQAPHEGRGTRPASYAYDVAYPCRRHWRQDSFGVDGIADSTTSDQTFLVARKGDLHGDYQY
jgi:hypothetical protein